MDSLEHSGSKWIIMWERLLWEWIGWLGSYVLEKSQLINLRIERSITSCCDSNVHHWGLIQSSNFLKARLILVFQVWGELKGNTNIFSWESECEWLLAHYRQKNKDENESDSEAHPILCVCLQNDSFSQ